MDKNKKMKKNIIILVIALCIALTLVSVGTYAAWIWRSTTNKDVVFNTSKEIQEYIIYDEGESKFIGDFQPTDTFCEGQYLTLSFSKTQEAANINLTATIKMDVNSIGNNISASSNVHWIVTTGDSSIACPNGLNSSQIVNSGTFNNVSSGNTITLSNEIPVTISNQTYTVWIWIDNSGSNSSLSGETLDVNVWTQIDMLRTDPGATFTDGVFLTWDELKLAENGTKYGYSASSISDTSVSTAFNSCNTLVSLFLPESVTAIPHFAFLATTSLNLVVFPSSLTAIEYSFDDPTVNVIFNGTVSQWNSISFGSAFEPGFPIKVICTDGIIILFKINNVPYFAEAGMTWSEWIESDYNTAGGWAGGAHADIPCTSDGAITNADGDYLDISDTIIAGYEYGVE